MRQPSCERIHPAPCQRSHASGSDSQRGHQRSAARAVKQPAGQRHERQAPQSEEAGLQAVIRRLAGGARVPSSEPAHRLAVRGKSADRDGLQGTNRRRALWPGEDLQRRRPPESVLLRPRTDREQALGLLCPTG